MASTATTHHYLLDALSTKEAQYNTAKKFKQTDFAICLILINFAFQVLTTS